MEIPLFSSLLFQNITQTESEESEDFFREYFRNQTDELEVPRGEICMKKVVMETEVVYDTEMICHHIEEENCYQTYQTMYRQAEVRLWLYLCVHTQLSRLFNRLKSVKRSSRRTASSTTRTLLSLNQLRSAMRSSRGTVRLREISSARNSMKRVRDITNISLCHMIWKSLH